MEAGTSLTGSSTSTILRRCARPGCADVANATLAFRYDLSQAWLTPLSDEKSPATYDLCGPCADRTAPPRGWELLDERPDLDSGAPDADDRDAVRDAIAAALRGEDGTVLARLAQAAAPLAERSSPSVVDQDVQRRTPFGRGPEVARRVPEVVRSVTPAPPLVVRPPDPEPTIATRAPRDVLAVRRARPGPVEVLIAGASADAVEVAGDLAAPAPSPVTRQVAATGDDRRQAGSAHAPVHHRLVATAPAAAAGAPAAPATIAPVNGTPDDGAEVFAPAPSPEGDGERMAFDTLPDRLVSFGSDAQAHEA